MPWDHQCSPASGSVTSLIRERNEVVDPHWGQGCHRFFGGAIASFGAGIEPKISALVRLWMSLQHRLAGSEARPVIAKLRIRGAASGTSTGAR